MQAGRQRIRHNANHPWFEFSQQLNERAPAFDLLICVDVSAHEARIRFFQTARQSTSSDLTVIPRNGSPDAHLCVPGVTLALMRPALDALARTAFSG